MEAIEPIDLKRLERIIDPSKRDEFLDRVGCFRELNERLERERFVCSGSGEVSRGSFYNCLQHSFTKKWTRASSTIPGVVVETALTVSDHVRAILFLWSPQGTYLRLQVFNDSGGTRRYFVEVSLGERDPLGCLLQHILLMNPGEYAIPAEFMERNFRTLFEFL